MSKPFFALFFSVLLSGCLYQEPKVFGVEQNVWATLSAQERQAAIDGYNKRKAIKESNRVASEAVQAARDVLLYANEE